MNNITITFRNQESALQFAKYYSAFLSDNRNIDIEETEEMVSIMEYDKDFGKYSTDNLEIDELGDAYINVKLPVFRISIPRNVVDDYIRLIEDVKLLEGTMEL